ncbi:MAG: LAGLIDADG family homing endonuclease [bacterium]|nr:LAGLIDADG family homing endonuclease [bacterium]
MLNLTDKTLVAYVIGIALGDGNLSNPNGRAVRLRITCDSKYPFLISKIEQSLKKLAPKNKVSRINRGDNAIDVSCYSNQWEQLLGWKAYGGSKIRQSVRIPSWIFRNKKLCQACLCGLWETDGSVYKDRKYITANFVTQIPSLAQGVAKMILKTRYKASIQKLVLSDNREKFTFRIHRNASQFIKEMSIEKR